MLELLGIKVHLLNLPMLLLFMQNSPGKMEQMPDFPPVLKNGCYAGRAPARGTDQSLGGKCVTWYNLDLTLTRLSVISLGHATGS